MKKSILIVSPFFPYPTFFGGAFDIWEKIKGLNLLEYNIDLVYTYKEQPKQSDVEHVKKFVNNIFPVERKNNPKFLLSKNPLQIQSRSKLKDIKLNTKYDIVLLESEYVSSILQNKTLSYKKKVLRVHNDEYIYFSNLTESTDNYVKKMYYYIESKKFLKFSDTIFKQMDRLWFISYDEQQMNEKTFNKNNTIHLPPPINETFKTRTLNTKNALFIGSLYMENNMKAVQWYLDNVHSEVIKKVEDYNLLICGSTGDYSEDYFIKKFSKIDNVSLYFNIADLEDVYSKAAIFINPMRHGSGVKLKSINALVNGIPLVATTIGSEGMEFVDKEMFFLANTPIEFINEIINVLNSEDKSITVKKAQAYLKSINYLDVLKKELQYLNEDG